MHGVIEPVFKTSYTVRSYECDSKSRILPHVLYSLLLDAAWGHVKNTGFSYLEFGKKGLFWVISRFLIRFGRLPVWDETIEVETWGKGTDKFYAFRDYVLRPQAGGEILASATSAWLILERDTLKPVRPAGFRDQFPVVEGKAALAEGPGKVDLPKDTEEVFSGAIAFSDIDVNRHMNAGKYLQWILDSYQEEFRLERNLRTIELNYMAEGYIGDGFRILRERKNQDGHEYLHSMIRAQDGKELCRARVLWD
jgi:medium-chain acyl-[acyl-carrier-protein] hydrolase